MKYLILILLFIFISCKDGANGLSGAAGNDGISSSGVVKVYDSGDNLVGFSVDLERTVLSDGAVAMFNFTTGKYMYSMITGDASVSTTASGCYFLNTGCSGVCYTASPTGTYEARPLKNSIFYDGTNFYQADGNETNVGAQAYQSRYYNGVCTDAAYGYNQGWAVTTGYTLPGSLTMPLSAPLYYGK